MKIRHTMEQFNRRLSSKPRQVFYTNVSPAKEGVGFLKLGMKVFG